MTSWLHCRLTPCFFQRRNCRFPMIISASWTKYRSPFDRGKKIGLVGRNGCGKSSLLKILAQESSADSGDCSRRKGLRVGYLPQAFELNETLSVRDNILEGASDVLAWIREYESGQGTERIKQRYWKKSIWQMAGTFLSPVPPMPPPFSPLLPWIVR